MKNLTEAMAKSTIEALLVMETSGSIYTRRLWNMIHDQIIQENKTIQEGLEKEVIRLDQREKELIQENARIKQQLAARLHVPLVLFHTS